MISLVRQVLYAKHIRLVAHRSVSGNLSLKLAQTVLLLGMKIQVL